MPRNIGYNTCTLVVKWKQLVIHEHCVNTVTPCFQSTVTLHVHHSRTYGVHGVSWKRGVNSDDTRNTHEQDVGSERRYWSRPMSRKLAKSG